MKKFNMGQKANWGGLVKELGCQIVTSISRLLHLCDETVEARQQFFDERSGKPITSQVLRSIDIISMSDQFLKFAGKGTLYSPYVEPLKIPFNEITLHEFLYILKS